YRGGAGGPPPTLPPRPPPRPPPPGAAKLVPSSDPMNSPWNPPALFNHSPCRSGRPSGSLGRLGADCVNDGGPAARAQTTATRRVRLISVAIRRVFPPVSPTSPRTPCVRRPA